MRNRNKHNVYALHVVLASSIAVFCLFGIRASFALLKDPIAESMNWSQAQVSLGFSFMMAVYAVTAFFCGLIVDKWGARPVFFISALSAASGLMLCGFMNSYLVYLLAFSVLNGISTGMLWVTSTICVRKWFVGRQYATKWGFAFTGAPAAQFILTYLVRYILVTYPENGWRIAFFTLSAISFMLLLIAFVFSKREPEFYNIKAFGSMSQHKSAAVWTLRKAYSKYPIWGAITMFLSSMMGEFLIWTQVVSYWVLDLGFKPAKAAEVYAVIGLAGIASMVLMGYFADFIVKLLKNEPKGRKTMLILGPFIGSIACAFLLLSGISILFAYTASFLFAFYWAIVPGGVVGYVGSMYGKQNLGKIWGLATLIVMGTGPFTGAFIGGYLKDLTGSYFYSILFASASFIISILFAISLPTELKQQGPQNNA